MRKITLLLCFLVTLLAYSQKKEITLEDIWTKGTFRQETIDGLSSMQDGNHYTSLEMNDKGAESAVVKYEYKTGKKIGNIISSSELISALTGKPITIDSYEFSADENKILIATETEKIYRHSTREVYYVYDIKTQKLDDVAGDTDKLMYGTFSPDGNKVAFVKNNNLFVKDLQSKELIQVTKDGKLNEIINGATDWVYEEEFEFNQAYQWNALGNKIAFYRFDESGVKEFEMSEYNESLYPSVYKFKYPKAGEANSIVSLFIFDIASKKTVPVAIPLDPIGTVTKSDGSIEKSQQKDHDFYIPRLQWTTDANTLSYQHLNRLQNKLQLILANAASGESKIILTETSKTYLEVSNNLTFLSNNKGFIWSSDKDGFTHLYLYDMNGKQMNQITKGNYDVLDFNGLDEVSKTVFYSSDETSVTEKCLYSVHLDGSGKRQLSAKGTNSPEFSSGFKYYINTFSDANTPFYITLNSSDGKLIRVIEDNNKLKKKLEDYALSKKEFFTFKTSEGVVLNAWMMKPTNFDGGKKYPVLLTFYGGPHNNDVTNEWGGSSYLWHNLLNQKGYIVVCVDNRGTEGRGRDFKKCTYKQLGKLETMDQIESAKYLGAQSYIDKTRIGVQGWSFGGYLSSLCMTKGADYFKAGIAVAPVTNWRFYDSVYTERYLSTPQDNPDGYDENSPINFANLLKGKYLLIHGSSDDNVHLQNSIEMSSALVKANKQFDQFIYPDKNHSIAGGTTRLHLFTKMTNFIVTNL